jgi:ribonuclease BN (tRNA processing enzyme)
MTGTASTEALLLGSGGWIPTAARATCSALVRRGDRALLIDAGTGVSRLVEDEEILRGVGELDVVLTHFHLDHVVGLAYLPALPVPAPPRLFGPGESLYGKPTEELLARLLDPPLFGLQLDSLVSHVGEIGEGALEIGPFALRARVQHHHNDPTLAFRIEDLLAYCTDTAYDERNAELARGCRTLVHEAWYTEDAGRDEATHASAREAAQIARDAKVERLVLIHVRPGVDEERLAAEARAVFEEAEVGRDLLRLL